MPNTTSLGELPYAEPIGIFFSEWVTRAYGGDFFAILSLLLALFVALWLVHKIVEYLMELVKKILILSTVAFAGYFFLTTLYSRYLTDGLGFSTIVFGFFGLIALVIAVSLALMAVSSVFKQEVFSILRKTEALTNAELRKEKKSSETKTKSSPESEKKILFPLKNLTNNTGWNELKETIRWEFLKNDPALRIALIYLLVTQFGIFSSKTTPAPSAEVGFGIWIVFVLGACFVSLQLYRDERIALRNLALMACLATVLAYALGIFWNGVEPAILFSFDFFRTDALVAWISSVGVGLYMGSRQE